MKRITTRIITYKLLLICLLTIQSIFIFSCYIDNISDNPVPNNQKIIQINDNFNSGWVLASSTGSITDTNYNGNQLKVLNSSNNSSVKYEKELTLPLDLTNSNFIILRCTPTYRTGKVYIYLTNNDYKGYAYHSLNLSSSGLPDTSDFVLSFAKSYFTIEGQDFDWASIKKIRVDYESTSSSLMLRDISNQQINLSTGIVIFSFDDGWKSQYTNAFPIMQNNRINATISLITYWTSTDNFLSADEIQTLYQAGNEIASHTAGHYDLNTLSSSDIENQINLARKWIINNNLGDCRTIIYPYESPLKNVIAIARKYHSIGLTIRRTPSPFVTYSVTSQMDLNRYLVPPDASLSYVKDLVQKAIDNKYLLILGFHAISDSDNPTSTRWPVDSFKAICEFSAQQRDIGKLKIMTAKEFFK